MHDVIEQLLACNANPNLTDNDGNVPLHGIDSNSSKWLLLLHGADCSRVNNRGEKPWGHYKGSGSAGNNGCCVSM